jgi:hypothetical protein
MSDDDVGQDETVDLLSSEISFQQYGQRTDHRKEVQSQSIQSNSVRTRDAQQTSLQDDGLSRQERRAPRCVPEFHLCDIFPRHPSYIWNIDVFLCDQIQNASVQRVQFGVHLDHVLDRNQKVAKERCDASGARMELIAAFAWVDVFPLCEPGFRVGNTHEKSTILVRDAGSIQQHFGQHPGRQDENIDHLCGTGHLVPSFYRVNDRGDLDQSGQSSKEDMRDVILDVRGEYRRMTDNRHFEAKLVFLCTP